MPLLRWRGCDVAVMFGEDVAKGTLLVTVCTTNEGACKCSFGVKSCRYRRQGKEKEEENGEEFQGAHGALGGVRCEHTGMAFIWWEWCTAS